LPTTMDDVRGRQLLPHHHRRAFRRQPGVIAGVAQTPAWLAPLCAAPD
jgi:hypothetical protein